ncbi:Transposase, Ptta/En/Spm, plant [Corchorus olitorius]|uniref:Transposase, Ptta/En/Spm, plant n=1 Tax=Corchorus olitorius TaxID=93759 RepID=A0A1R3KUF4_9ROSI|nr:Transposase, Ptta/En/Spm, plant [Corchorus olitorius]
MDVKFKNVHCTSRRPRRNDERVNDPSLPAFSIFNYPGRFHGQPRARLLNQEELHVAHTYVLRNCPEVQPYYAMFVNYLRRQGHTAEEIDLGVDTHFHEWFKRFVQKESNGVTDPTLCSIAWGPSKKAKCWPAYFVNGYNFHTVAHGEWKATMNSGICVRSSDAHDHSSDFYGLLEDVVQIEYLGRGIRKHVYYTYPLEQHKKMFRLFSSVASNMLKKAYWQSPAFKKLSDQNTKNRLANGSNLTSGYRGGCVKTTVYVDRLTVKLDRLPYPNELFEVTHGTKKGTYPEGRAQDTIKRYDDALKAAVEAAGDDEVALAAIDKYQIWINVAGGSRGRVYGLGVLAQLGPRATVSPQFSTTQELKNTVQQLQQ